VNIGRVERFEVDRRRVERFEVGRRRVEHRAVCRERRSNVEAGVRRWDGDSHR